ncbi:acyltransferase [Litoricolaceae bacterium]|nr:acyltransferase [Litorivicinaceae bacterium]
MHSSKLSYRAEIDGLRAIAVVAVILYHTQIVIFGRDWFTGGFIGVDIFFVISGYLITRIILTQLEQKNTFSFIEFYERRARRILPMLFIIIFVSIPYAWQKLIPAAFIEYAESIFSNLYFGSNFFFYSIASDYGAQNTLTMPFLHTWSLAVEEQFYLFFPFLAILLWKAFRKYFLAVIGAFVLLSLLFADVMESRNAMFNFFLPYSRFWELACGSFLAAFELIYGPIRKSWAVNLLPIFGLYLIFYGVLFFDGNTKHPSFYTLIPIIGVSIIILFASKDELVGKILSSKPFVGIGLISYSAYMWHYPIFAFSRIGKVPSNYDKLEWLALTLILSIASYYLIERPFRSREIVKTKILLIFLSISAAFVLAFYLYSIDSKGAKYYQEPISLSDKPPTNDDARIAIVGDSHAEHLGYGMLVKTNGGIRMYHSGGCIPFRDVDRFDYRFTAGDCATHTNASLDEIINNKTIDTVILSTMGPVYLDNTVFQHQDLARVTKQRVVDMRELDNTDTYSIFKNGFKRTVNELLGSGKKVVFVIDVPELGTQFHSCRLVKNINTRWRPYGPLVEGDVVDKPNCRYSRRLYDERANKYRSMLMEMEKEFPSVLFIDTPKYFCDSNFCFGYKDNVRVYRDADHLNEYGSLYVAELILRELAQRKR